MLARIQAEAALRGLPEAWALILAAIGTHRRAWITEAELATPTRDEAKAALPGIDPGPCRAMEAAGWLAQWEVFGVETEQPDAPPPGVTAWTLTPWAAEVLGVELDEPGGDDRPARWVEIRVDEDGDRVPVTRPIVLPWHRDERLAPWIERLSEDRRKALMGSGPKVVETLKDEISGQEIRLFAGPDGKGVGVAIVREVRKLGKAARRKERKAKRRRAG